MTVVLRIVFLVSRAGAWFGGVLILLAALLIGVDVTLRQLFVVTIGGADELAGFSLAIGSAWAFGFTLLRRRHIRIDTVYVTLPVRIRAFLDILGLVAFSSFMLLVTWHAFGVVQQSITSNSHSISPLGTPLAVPQALWALGLVSFMCVALLLLVQAVISFISGDTRTVAELIGSRSVAEEARHELEEADDSN